MNETAQRPARLRGVLETLRPVDVCVALLLTAAPLVMGGRHPLGQLVFVTLMGVTSIAVVVEGLSGDRSWRQTPGLWLVLAGLMIPIIQLLPLPPVLLRVVSPGIAEMLPLWTSVAPPHGIGIWHQVSLTPSATSQGLVLYAAYGMLFVLLVQRMRRLEDVERLLKLVAIATIGMAGLGLLQYLMGAERFLWVYEHPSRVASGEVKGPFSNENHFAHLLALGVGPLLWWLHGSLRSRPSAFIRAADARTIRHDETRSVWLFSGLIIVALAGLLTYSRGGVLILACAAIVSIGLLAARSLLPRQSFVGVFTMALFLIVALGIHGYESLSGQLSTLQLRDLRDLPELLGREQIWAADVRAIAESPILGTGAGSHREVYPIYLKGVSSVEYTHAESGYLQVLVETGLVGGVLLLCAIALCAFWCVTGIRRSSCPSQTAAAIAVTASLSVSVLHSVWDFVWYIPACMTVTVVLAAAACRLYQMNRPSTETAPRSLHAGSYRKWHATIPVTAVVCVMVWSHFGPALAAVHWDGYLRTRRAMAIAVAESAGTFAVSEQRHWNDRLLTQVEDTLRCHPDHARAHLRAAQLNLAQFELAQQTAVNAMPLPSIRDAVRSAPFSTPDERSEWLSAVLAENRAYLERSSYHARQAVRLCPLQGEGYVCWGDVAFLNHDFAGFEAELIEQALTLRPSSGAVLLAAGRAAISRGDVDNGLRYWKRAFAAEPELQIQLFEALRRYTSVEFLLAELEPDLESIRRLSSHCVTTGQPEIQRAIAVHHAALLEQMAVKETGVTAANLWHEAQGVHDDLGNADLAAECGRRAVFHAPEDVAARKGCVARLIEAGCLVEALEYVDVGLGQDPHDPQLHALRNDILRRVSTRDAAGPGFLRPPPIAHNLPDGRESSVPTSR